MPKWQQNLSSFCWYSLTSSFNLPLKTPLTTLLLFLPPLPQPHGVLSTIIENIVQTPTSISSAPTMDTLQHSFFGTISIFLSAIKRTVKHLLLLRHSMKPLSVPLTRMQSLNPQRCRHIGVKKRSQFTFFPWLCWASAKMVLGFYHNQISTSRKTGNNCGMHLV